ncbi:MAG: sulfur carrier protein ThiS adenylyltransferase ThiF [Planctomycetes bacterium]|nr:sulfur carrier protein ThiS adenylyltransferase ThiF [Planctomycetota bacterium]
MKIKLNEQPVELHDEGTVFDVRDRFKPDADVVILNGAPVNKDCAISDGDEVVLIQRGEEPSREELEALMAARHTPGVHKRVKEASVGIAGLGGLGSAIAIALTRTGVGRLVLADFDIVEPSNLNRQQYFVDQLGQPKTEALAENLRRINPYVRVETHRVRLDASNVSEVFADVEVLVEAFDAPDAKTMLLESFATAFPDKPIVMASGLAGHGPGSTIQVRKLGSQIYVIGDMESAAQPGRGLMAPRVGIAAHLQANTVLRLLLGEEGE